MRFPRFSILPGGVVKVEIFEVDMKMALFVDTNDYIIKVDIEHCT